MNKGFIRKKLESVPSLGERLKKARHRANVTLDELSQATKIQKNYLVYLEENQYSLLPADVYVKGYLKQYASYLGLDYDEILELYKRERGIHDHIKKQSLNRIKDSRFYLGSFDHTENKLHRKVNFIITPRMIRISIITLFVFGLFFYLWIQLHTLAAPPKLEIYEPANDITIKNDSITIKGKTEPEVELFINDQPIFINEEGNFEEKIGLSYGMNNLIIKARSRIGRETVINRKILVEFQEENKIIQKENESEKCSDGIELTITIKDSPTWLHILEDDKVVFSQIAAADFSQTFQAKEKITLSSGKAYNTLVEFCGRNLGALGEKGEVVRSKEFTREMIE